MEVTIYSKWKEEEEKKRFWDGKKARKEIGGVNRKEVLREKEGKKMTLF
jgi:hypothetical protein